MNYRKWIRCAVTAGLLAGGTAACDFVEPTSSNPNTVPDATVDQLFVGSQVNLFIFNGGELSRLTSVWMQQMAGTDRQMLSLDGYDQILEDTGDTEYSRVYRQGGLINLREAQARAEAEGRRVYAGILKIQEAYLIGMAASIWGDFIYREAVSPEYSTCQAADGSDCPHLDDQAQVYADVQALLDEAIADIDSGEGEGPLGNDLNFGGDPASWRAVAHTLKARFYMHWAEVDDSNYGLALQAAADGIPTADGNWNQVHGSAITNSNLWYQFQNDRSGYIKGNSVMVELLDVDGDSLYNPAVDDDRLPIYFRPGTGGYAGKYVGSPVGEPAGDPADAASDLNMFRQATFGQPIVTCWENHFIIAEAELAVGTAANASTAMQNALDCQVDYWDSVGPTDVAGNPITVDLGTAPDAASITLDDVMTAKYVAQFLNIDTWNDWKRTCIPALTPAPGFTDIPSRLFYADDESQANVNMPTASEQGAIPGSRNDNDPNSCF